MNMQFSAALNKLGKSLPIVISLLLVNCGGETANAPVNWAVSNATVTAYAVANGIKSSVLDSTTSDVNGNYRLAIGGYSGSVLLSVSGGFYLDAATMEKVPLNSSLWSVLGFASNNISTNITPLSDVMVILAAELPGGINAANVAAAASMIKNTIGFDPSVTSPADPTKPSFSTKDSAEKAYGIYLGVISQYLKDHRGKKLTDATSDFADAFNGNSLFDTPEIKKSVENFLVSQNNKTGVNNSADLENLTVSLGGVLSGAVPAAIPNIIPVIQTENAKTSAQGVSSAWRITNIAWNHEIEGYASATSINHGESIDFYINTIDPAYSISVYRIGWYGGVGGRLVAEPTSLTGMIQPTCPMDATTGMVECNWTRSYTLTIPDNLSDPTDWASGVYLVKLTGSGGKQNYINFVVRDDKHISDFLFQTSVTTYQAYNNWGGKSLYAANSTNSKPAQKVSFNRPYRLVPFLQYEIEMVSFLEKEGFDVSYTTNIDTHVAGYRLQNHKAFLSVGHDEYWTKKMRDSIEAARDAGVNIGFFGANAGFWQFHFEPDSVSRPNRTIAAFRTASPTMDPVYFLHPERSATLFRSILVNRPEAMLVGVMFDLSPFDLDMVIKDCKSYVCSGTALIPGSTLPHMLGNEVDRLDASSPAGIQVIASSPYNVCLDSPACSRMETRYSSATRYQASSGAEVFATGSMQWNWGLSMMGGNVVYSNADVQQMTRNVLNHFIGK